MTFFDGKILSVEDFLENFQCVKGKLAEKYPNLIEYYEKRINGFKLGVNKMNKNDENVIAETIKLPEPEMKILARGLAYAVSYKQFRYIVSRKYSKLNPEDAMQSLYQIICENLENFDPSYNITTFLTPYVNKFFSDEFAFEANGGIRLTRYYVDCILLVNKAIQALGLDDISASDATSISQYIGKHFSRKLSTYTVEKCLSYIFVIVHPDKTTESDDSRVFEIADRNRSSDPANVFKEKEQVAEFREIFDSLTPKNKKILTFFLEFAAKNPNKAIMETSLYRYAKENGYTESQSVFSSAFKSAKNELKMKILRSREINTVRGSAPIEVVNFDNRFYTEKDDDDFAGAMMGNMDALSIENLI